MTGEIGLLPNGFPDIGVIVKQVKRLKQTNFVLDIENKKCTCKGNSKSTNILTNPLENNARPQPPNKFLLPESLRVPRPAGYPSSASPLENKISRAKQNGSSVVSSQTQLWEARVRGPSQSPALVRSTITATPVHPPASVHPPVRIQGPVPVHPPARLQGPASVQAPVPVAVPTGTHELSGSINSSSQSVAPPETDLSWLDEVGTDSWMEVWKKSE